MVVSEKQKRSRMNQKKRKPEESPHSNMVVVSDLDEEQISPKDSGKKMKKVKSPHSNMVAIPDLDEQQISPKDRGKKMKKDKSPHSNMVAEEGPHSNMVAVCDFDEEQISPKDSRKKMKKKKYSEGEGSRVGENKLTLESNSLPSCIDKLREEFSCPVCWELFVEPVSTWCGHSFCSSCLYEALIIYGDDCPNCRQLISFSLSYNVNTAIQNTIELLFPQEAKARLEVLIKEYWKPDIGKHIRFEQEEE